MEFEVVLGDITEQRADALVNETISGTNPDRNDAISEIVGDSAVKEIQEKVTENSPLLLGEPVETSAPNLDVEIVIHVATIGHTQHPNRTGLSTRNVLSKADDLGCTSVVLPIIYSTWTNVDYCAGMMFEEISEYDPDTLADVRVIVQDSDARKVGLRIDDCYQIIQQIAEEVRTTEDD